MENNTTPLDFSRTYSDQKSVAAFMNNQKGTILLDTSSGFAIPLFAKNPKQYILTSDVDFLIIVKNYKKRADWIILRDPSLDTSTNNILTNYYPKMWNGELSSAHLFRQIDDWRIYKVIRL